VRGMHLRFSRALSNNERFFFVQERLPRLLQKLVMFVSLGHFGFPPPVPSKGLPPWFQTFKKMGKRANVERLGKDSFPHAPAENLRPLGPNGWRTPPIFVKQTGIIVK
jgi:hypothetical protein